MRFTYGTLRNSGFSLTACIRTSLLKISLPVTPLAYCTGFACATPPALGPVFPFPASVNTPCPHSSDHMQYRNLHLLSIGYVFRPRLRPRLTQGRSALPWKPWIFGHKDSHLVLATHSGILSSMQSTAPYGTASSRMQCSSTNLAVPQLRQHVSAPDIFGAGPLD